MPTMQEIYKQHSFQYDELVSHEDYQNNLAKTLHGIFNFQNKEVIELGVGTGRVTKLYIGKAEKAFCFDRSQHMIDRAKQNLQEFSNKIDFAICDNTQLNQIQQKADCIIEGWSFGHTVDIDISSIPKQTENLINSCQNCLKKDGIIIIIETLGTHVHSPTIPSEKLKCFYQTIEKDLNFKRITIETDYKFSSVEEASRISGFFFGEDMGKNIKENGSAIIKEFTGIWHRKIVG